MVLLLILMAAGNLSTAQESLSAVEEIVAVVGTSPLLASDLDLAALVSLVPTQPGQPRPDRSQLLDARIRLELVQSALEQSGAIYQLEVDVGASLAELEARAGGAEALAARLQEAGLDMSDVEELAHRLAVSKAFVQRDLRPQITVTLEELEAAHRDLASRLEREGEPVPDLLAVRDQLHRLLVERKLNDELQRWLEQARERVPVTRFEP